MGSRAGLQPTSLAACRYLCRKKHGTNRRDGRFAKFADDIHFSDIPNPAFWHDEIVSSEAVIIVEFGLVVLRCDDPIGRGWWWRGRRIVHLIVEDDSRRGRDWRNNRYGNRG